MAKLKKEPLSVDGPRPRADGVQPAPPDAVQVPAADVRRGDQPADRPVPRGRGDVADDVPRPRRRTCGGQPAAGDRRRRTARSSRWNCRRRSSRDAIIEEIRQNEVLGFKLLDATFPLSGGAGGAARRASSRSRATRRRPSTTATTSCASRTRKRASAASYPIPSLLALGAVHQYLCRQGLRDQCSLIVQAGDIQEGHDVCCLVAFGADAVHPYLMLRLVKDGLTFKDPDTKQEFAARARECLENLFAALEDTHQEDHLQDGHHDHRGLPRGACSSRRSGSART